MITRSAANPVTAQKQEKPPRKQEKSPQKSARKQEKPPARKKWTDAAIIKRFSELGKAASLTNASKLARELRLPLKQVKNALAKNKGIQQHMQYNKRFPRRKLIALPFKTMTVDLKDLSSLSEFNNGYKWLLFSLDIGSRYLQVKAMRSKTAREVSKTLADIFDDMQRHKRPLPFKFYSDLGREFDNKMVTQLLRKKNIEWYYTSDGLIKSSAVERVIQTITQMIYRHFTLTNSFEYLSVLPLIVESYNKTEHPLIGMPPGEVTVHDGNRIWHRTHPPQPSKPKPPALKTGDYVFMTRDKRRFTKGYKKRLTGELFRIRKVILTAPVTYEVSDLAGDEIRGSFYEGELVKSSRPSLFEIEEILRSSGGRHLVKWRYYPKSMNSWVLDRDITRL